MLSFLAGTPVQLSRIVPDYPSEMFRLKLSTDVEANLYHFDISDLNLFPSKKCFN